MAVCDLSKRITDDWALFNALKMSNESLVFVDGGIFLEESGPTSINVTVGSQVYSKGTYTEISGDGITLQPGYSILLETKQRFALPNNVYGLISGVGRNIFRCGFVSSGKINPGFDGKLRIGYYNGNEAPITFKPDDLLCCCTFFEIETTLSVPLQEYLQTPPPLPAIVEFDSATRVKKWLSSNWQFILSMLLSGAAVVLAYLSYTK